MKNFIKLTLLFIIFLMASNNRASASHIIGGDIVYRCLGNNKFGFTFTLYHDCLGTPQAIIDDAVSYYSIFNAVSGAPVLASQSMGNYTLEQTIPSEFANECINNAPNTCMSKMVFEFEVILPPSVDGYIFVFQRCCRNQSLNNIYAPGITGGTFTTYIPPFTNGQCINNSAVFDNAPPQIICADNPFTFDFSATDLDGDSLTYELCNSYVGGGPNQGEIKPGSPGNMPNDAPPHVPVSYVPPNTATNPLPGNPAFSINPATGLLTGTPTSVGRYAVAICVKEWRNGVLINTNSRDLQFVVTGCSRAVIANLPSLSDQPDVYMVRCDSVFTVNFQHNSTGGFSYFWDFGNINVLSDTSNLENPSYTYPDTGTYYVKLVVNRGSTCADSTIRMVKIYPKFEVDFDISGKFCKGEPINFVDQSRATFPTVYGWEWDLGDGQTSTQQNPIHSYTSNHDDYVVTLFAKTTKGCADTITKKITFPRFTPFPGNDTIVIKGHTFNMSASGGSVYHWTPATYLANANDPRSSIMIPDTGVYKYYLNIVSEVLCEANDSVKITVVERPYFIVPSAFSPNGDGVNDVIRPIIAGFPNISYFKIYNRWGQVVFQMFSNKSGGWDGTFKGKRADAGVYFWDAEAANVDGKLERFAGDLTLIR